MLAIFVTFGSLLILHECDGHNKYSAEANKKAAVKKVKVAPMPDDVPSSLRELDKPYRMAKLNLLWTKAKHVSKIFF